ncbi:hypothetical protein [Massilia genomosp. 1]|uniref:hypothetical protein n=1 Tax=Massilia genomosp. 1 TaxID=2609280 RepID=UPI001420C9BF|nr:hypothetical protein [Massilia genomosp. 1]
MNDDGTLFIKNELMHGFMRGFQSMEEGDLYCPMSGLPAAKPVPQVIRFERAVAA